MNEYYYILLRKTTIHPKSEIYMKVQTQLTDDVELASSLRRTCV